MGFTPGQPAGNGASDGLARRELSGQLAVGLRSGEGRLVPQGSLFAFDFALTELTAARSGGSVRLERALRPRSRFEVRVAMAERVARLARYQVERRGRWPKLVGSGCLDSAGARRDCPA